MSAFEPIIWPEGKRFAFTVFDDPDFQTLECSKAVYDFLGNLGFRTTKGVWTMPGPVSGPFLGTTCDEPAVLEWTEQLQKAGFEIGLHNVAPVSSDRNTTLEGLNRYREMFGHDPRTVAQHYLCDESVYWGAERVSGIHKLIYTASTLGKKAGRFHGHVPGHPYFWGDLCRDRVTYLRNFVYRNINTLAMCPAMPYTDPDRSYVRYWYASTEGVNAYVYEEAINEAAQDRLEAEGGACIMYTHFAYRFYSDGQLRPRFRELMTRLSKKNGWFVPVGTLLDFLRSRQPSREISRGDRARLERRWLLEKIRYGTA